VREKICRVLVIEGKYLRVSLDLEGNEGKDGQEEKCFGIEQRSERSGESTARMGGAVG